MSRLPRGLDKSIVDVAPESIAPRESPRTERAIDLSDTRPSAAGLRPRLPTGAVLRRALQAPYEPLACGPWPARQAVADWLRERGRAALAEDVVLAASTSEAFSWLLQWWCVPGARMAHMVPGYPLLPHLAEAQGVGSVPIASTWAAGRWSLDCEALHAALAAGVRVVVITSPNNPTGACLRADEATKVAALCNRYQALCIVDEVFGPFVLEGTWPKQPLANCERVVSLGGLSKAALLPQAKLSWLHVGGSASFRQQAHIHLTWLGDLCLSVSAMAAAVAESVLPQLGALEQRVKARLRGNARWLRHTLRREAIGELLPMEGGFVAPVQLSPQVCARFAVGGGGRGAEALAERARVIWQPAYLYDLPDDFHVVASLLLPPAQLKRGWQRVGQAMATDASTEI